MSVDQLTDETITKLRNASAALGAFNLAAQGQVITKATWDGDSWDIEGIDLADFYAVPEGVLAIDPGQPPIELIKVEREHVDTHIPKFFLKDQRNNGHPTSPRRARK